MSAGTRHIRLASWSICDTFSSALYLVRHTQSARDKLQDLLFVYSCSVLACEGKCLFTGTVVVGWCVHDPHSPVLLHRTTLEPLWRAMCFWLPRRRLQGGKQQLLSACLQTALMWPENGHPSVQIPSTTTASFPPLRQKPSHQHLCHYQVKNSQSCHCCTVENVPCRRFILNTAVGVPADVIDKP